MLPEIHRWRARRVPRSRSGPPTTTGGQPWLRIVIREDARPVGGHRHRMLEMRRPLGVR